MAQERARERAQEGAWPETKDGRVDLLAAVADHLLQRSGLSVVYADGEIERAAVVAPDGMLPYLMLEADDLWRTATRGRLPSRIAVEDDDTLLGLRIDDVPAAPPSLVFLLLSTVIDRLRVPGHGNGHGPGADQLSVDGLLRRWDPLTVSVQRRLSKPS